VCFDLDVEEPHLGLTPSFAEQATREWLLDGVDVRIEVFAAIPNGRDRHRVVFADQQKRLPDTGYEVTGYGIGVRANDLFATVGRHARAHERQDGHLTASSPLPHSGKPAQSVQDFMDRSGVENNRHRTVVHELDRHASAEDAMLDMDAQNS
jgi:hypothetical protein